MNEWQEAMDTGNSQALIYSKESDEITRKLNRKIYEAAYRILLVWLPEKMHSTCANKLLKMIEEPPANTAILMVSEEPDRVLGTIQSRTQRINGRRVGQNDLARALVNREMLEPAMAREIAHLSGGSYLKALELISTNEENEFYLEQFKEMMRNSWARNVMEMKTSADLLAGIGRERQKNFLAYCQRLIRENFVYHFQEAELNYMNIQEARFAAKFAPFVNERNVVDLTNELAKAERHIIQNVNPKMVFFDLALRLTAFIRQ
jgi:DNA polymerase-3 subunit delta'